MIDIKRAVSDNRRVTITHVTSIEQSVRNYKYGL